MAKNRNALIIGAGAAGLATAHALRQVGIHPTVLERGARPGTSWRRRYDGLRLNTVRTMSSLPGYTMEPAYGTWPDAQNYADYLARYAGRNRLDVRCAVEASGVAQKDSQWSVETNAGPFTAPILVIATGRDRVRKDMIWPGRDAFKGAVLHSSEFKNAALFVGKNVVVVGAGNSACEIAARLARHGANAVHLAVRSGPLLLSRTYFGVPLTYWSVPGRLATDFMLDIAGRLMQRWAFGNVRRYGLPLPAPDHTLSALRHSRYIPTVDGMIVDELAKGRVKVVGAVKRFTADGVALSDGTHIPCNVVIAATGFDPGLAPLVGHFDVLDSRGLPRSLHPAPGLFFNGFRFDLSAGLPYFKVAARRIAAMAAKHSS